MNSAVRQMDSIWPVHPHAAKMIAPMSNSAGKAGPPGIARVPSSGDTNDSRSDPLAHQSEFSAAQHAISNSNAEGLEDDVFHLLKVAAGALRVSRVSLWLFDNDRETLRLYKMFDGSLAENSERTPLSVAAFPNYFEALQQGAVLAIESVPSDPRADGGADGQSREASSAIDVPIRAFANYVGVLRHDHIGVPRRWSEVEQIFAASVGASVSLAIERQEHRQEIGERRRADQYDKLTNLASLALLRERIALTLDPGADRKDKALLLLDIDRFRLINEGFGKSVGDAVLCEVAQRLRAAFPQADAIARIGNDEFAILLSVDDTSEGTICAAQVRASLTLPYVVSNRELTLGATVGIVSSSRGYSQAEAMLHDAEAALNRAKCRGKGCAEVFSPSMYDVSLRRLDLEGELKNAVRRGELLYHYQPIIEMRTGQIRSSEALIRWHHPRRGLLPPSQFIEAIEESGLLPVVGWSLLPGALSRLRRWRNRVGFGSEFTMNLNLTGQQLLQPGVVEGFHIELARHRLPPSALRIEVTENTLISGQAELIGALNRLADMGVEIQLDDFGTGFASLRHLSELPLSAVKIDRSFVTPLLKGKKEASIVESLIAMAHGLGLKVIAEGIESTDQFDLLDSLGCDYAQGFLIGKPMPFDQFNESFAPSFLAQGHVHE